MHHRILNISYLHVAICQPTLAFVHVNLFICSFFTCIVESQCKRVYTGGWTPTPRAGEALNWQWNLTNGASEQITYFKWKENEPNNLYNRQDILILINTGNQFLMNDQGTTSKYISCLSCEYSLQ